MNKSIYVIIIIIALGTLYFLIPGEESQAETLEEGIELAKEQDKLVFLYVTSDWCTYCSVIEQEFARSEEFRNIIKEHFIWVTLDFDRNPAVVSQFNLRGTPAIIILDQNGKPITGMLGYPPGGVSDVISMLKEALR
ncbi:MAG: thioredoxin family protein [Theionarchaea archaeon]|nr:MAG: hypothetical protein AYK18_08330 [Theionarchaea archaeon DG-70]MBU7011533.1 thioredoxin family protein [Theionarchaea archaeon]